MATTTIARLDLAPTDPGPRRPTERLARRVALVVAVALVLTTAGLGASPARALDWAENSFSAESESQLIALTNQARAAAGLPALKKDSVLTDVARWRSKDMIVRDYFSHTIPPTGDGVDSVFDELSRRGYCFKLAGENIGWNNYPDDVATAAIHEAFMNSSGHRANILGKSWDVIGVGAYKGPGGKKMWTVLFADKCGTATPTATPRPTPKPTPKPTAKPVATPKPTAKPVATPKPTPRPTPVATATPSPTPTPIPSPTATPDDVLRPSPRPASPSAPPSAAPAAVRPPALGVVEPWRPPGLVETIVAGVAGTFFGW
jgi:uncharacterized protein YkwD